MQALGMGTSSERREAEGLEAPKSSECVESFMATSHAGGYLSRADLRPIPTPCRAGSSSRYHHGQSASSLVRPDLSGSSSSSLPSTTGGERQHMPQTMAVTLGSKLGFARPGGFADGFKEVASVASSSLSARSCAPTPAEIGSHEDGNTNSDDFAPSPSPRIGENGRPPSTQPKINRLLLRKPQPQAQAQTPAGHGFAGTPQSGGTPITPAWSAGQFGAQQNFVAKTLVEGVCESLQTTLAPCCCTSGGPMQTGGVGGVVGLRQPRQSIGEVVVQCDDDPLKKSYHGLADAMEPTTNEWLPDPLSSRMAAQKQAAFVTPSPASTSASGGPWMGASASASSLASQRSPAVGYVTPSPLPSTASLITPAHPRVDESLTGIVGDRLARAASGVGENDKSCCCSPRLMESLDPCPQNRTARTEESPPRRPLVPRASGTPPREVSVLTAHQNLPERERSSASRTPARGTRPALMQEAPQAPTQPQEQPNSARIAVGTLRPPTVAVADADPVPAPCMPSAVLPVFRESKSSILFSPEPAQKSRSHMTTPQSDSKLSKFSSPQAPSVCSSGWSAANCAGECVNECPEGTEDLFSELRVPDAPPASSPRRSPGSLQALTLEGSPVPDSEAWRTDAFRPCGTAAVFAGLSDEDRLAYLDRGADEVDHRLTGGGLKRVAGLDFGAMDDRTNLTLAPAGWKPDGGPVLPTRVVYFPEPPMHASDRIYHEGHYRPWTPRFRTPLEALVGSSKRRVGGLDFERTALPL
eukprot:TRINITY_DN81305_c0_g1_i1.p1 TRINITY_DN81305_c0_g1~~TRINITY_DN81305_c0_g1_i1.p1  ORF type:complete len:755 (+),score=120.20 TRINITY_DN81305_c0_g1_i1:90-2354(+)